MSALDALKSGIAGCIATSNGGNTYDSCLADFYARLEVATNETEREEAYYVLTQCLEHKGASQTLLDCIDSKWQIYESTFG
jgi:hypothetical protein